METPFLHSLSYADNILHLEAHASDFLAMLDITDKFENKWSLSFNERKSKMLSFGKGYTINNDQ